VFERRCRCVCPHELKGITDNQTVFQREVTDPNDWYANYMIDPIIFPIQKYKIDLNMCCVEASCEYCYIGSTILVNAWAFSLALKVTGL